MAYEECMEPLRSASGGKLNDDQIAVLVDQIHGEASAKMRAGADARTAATEAANEAAVRAKIL